MSMKQIREVSKGPDGRASKQENLDYWSNRAEKNSNNAHRASDGPIELPNTGGSVSLHDTAARRGGDDSDSIFKKAKADLNHDGDSPFMRSVRRKV
jgi:hypothetical protein